MTVDELRAALDELPAWADDWTVLVPVEDELVDMTLDLERVEPVAHGYCLLRPVPYEEAP